jgi:uncharacterized protein (TIGR03118 family)
MLQRFTRPPGRRMSLAAAGVGLLALSVPALASAHNAYRQSNLVSDQPGVAMVTDPNLVNSWGLSAGPTTPIWVADNGTGLSTIYPGAVGGMPISIAPLVVSIPQGAPTGTVFNPTRQFKVWNGSAWVPSVFLFDSEAGLVSGWPGAGTAAITAKTVMGGEFKGLTMATPRGWGPLLYAADFAHKAVDVFNGRFKRVMVPGGFRDPGLPGNYAPFGIQAISGKVFVTFAKTVPGSGDEVDGPGLGFVDEFTPTGWLVRRIATRGVLNAPWGLAQAPGNFGPFSHDLLVGNFGDGLIHAFSLETGLMGVLRRPDGMPVHIDGLWGLRFGNGATGGSHGLLFAAGPDGESHGLFGVLRFAH